MGRTYVRIAYIVACVFLIIAAWRVETSRSRQWVAAQPVSVPPGDAAPPPAAPSPAVETSPDSRKLAVLEKQVEEQRKLIQELEEAQNMPERVTEASAAGVALVVGEYLWMDTATNRPLRFQGQDASGDYLRDKDGRELTSFDGDGPPVVLAQGGSGPRGLMLLPCLAVMNGTNGPSINFYEPGTASVPLRSGNVVLITGASRGFGGAAARQPGRLHRRPGGRPPVACGPDHPVGAGLQAGPLLRVPRHRGEHLRDRPLERRLGRHVRERHVRQPRWGEPVHRPGHAADGRLLHGLLPRRVAHGGAARLGGHLELEHHDQRHLRLLPRRGTQRRGPHHRLEDRPGHRLQCVPCHGGEHLRRHHLHRHRRGGDHAPHQRQPPEHGDLQQLPRRRGQRGAPGGDERVDGGGFARREQAAGQARVIAGGTDLLVKPCKDTAGKFILIDIGDIPELTGITSTAEGLKIGAATRLAEIASSPLLNNSLRVLSVAAATVGSPQIRNRATIGGNLCNASPSADTVPPLLPRIALQRIALWPAEDVERYLRRPDIKLLIGGMRI